MHGAGEYRKAITIQSRSTSVDAVGGQSTTWTTYLTTRADIQPLTGRELLAGQEVKSQVDTMILMRYRSGITADMRVVYGSTIYNIAAVIDEEMRHRWLTLLCATGLNQG